MSTQNVTTTDCETLAVKWPDSKLDAQSVTKLIVLS